MAFFGSDWLEDYDSMDEYEMNIGMGGYKYKNDDYDKPNNIDENRWTNNKTPKQIEEEYNKNMNIIYEPPFECCKDCPNNFKNNPSSGGVCSCDLPYQEMFRW